MKNNLFIRETAINVTEKYSFGKSGWYETFADNIKTLFRSLQKQYGKASKMYVDKDGETIQTGWVFSKNDKYEDTGETYKREVWVEVSTTEPVKECKTKNIHYPFK
jgi:hypothetical protein